MAFRYGGKNKISPYEREVTSERDVGRVRVQRHRANDMKSNRKRRRFFFVGNTFQFGPECSSPRAINYE